MKDVSKLELDVYESTRMFIYDLNEESEDDPYKLEVSGMRKTYITFSIFKRNEKYASCSIPQDGNCSKPIIVRKNKVFYTGTFSRKENKVASGYLSFLTENIPGIKKKVTLHGFD